MPAKATKKKTDGEQTDSEEDIKVKEECLCLSCSNKSEKRISESGDTCYCLFLQQWSKLKNSKGEPVLNTACGGRYYNKSIKQVRKENRAKAKATKARFNALKLNEEELDNLIPDNPENGV